MNIINFLEPSISGLSSVIKWLIQISSSIAVGVILFTLILKLITLPFDFFSRASMRKNALKMEAMRPELEKLQKQYANDKTKYNQKMMALYKKNGYSMWGACLPTIITLVIFIVAINAFTSYSAYQNRRYFYDMSVSYNNAIYAGLENDGDLIKTENGTYVIDYDGIYNKYNESINVKNTVGTKINEKINESDNKINKILTKTYTKTYHLGEKIVTNSSNTVNTIINCYKTTKINSTTPYTGEGDNKVLGEEVFDTAGERLENYQMSVKTTNGYILHRFNFSFDAKNVDKFVLGSNEFFEVIESNLTNPSAKNEYNNNLTVTIGDKAYTYGEEYKTLKTKEYITNYNAYVEEFNQQVDDGEIDEPKKELYDITEGSAKYNEVKNDIITKEYFLQEICQEMSAKTYRNNDTGFLWVKNIWVTDSPLSHPIAGDLASFKSAYDYDDETIDDEDYLQLIAKLTDEQDEPNGYFILAVLTAGISFLTQFVMSKSQKSQMELQTVDGQGARTQKIMMWMMPIMMAFFSFMYTAAFSIYMVLSSVISILTTLGINWIVGKKYSKLVKANENQTIRGRVYVPEVVEEEKPAKKDKKAQNNLPAPNEKDFMNGGEKNHIRGRLK